MRLPASMQQAVNYRWKLVREQNNVWWNKQNTLVIAGKDTVPSWQQLHKISCRNSQQCGFWMNYLPNAQSNAPCTCKTGLNVGWSTHLHAIPKHSIHQITSRYHKHISSYMLQHVLIAYEHSYNRCETYKKYIWSMKFMPNGSKNKKFVANRHTYAKVRYNVANVANRGAKMAVCAVVWLYLPGAYCLNRKVQVHRRHPLQRHAQAWSYRTRQIAACDQRYAVILKDTCTTTLLRVISQKLMRVPVEGGPWCPYSGMLFLCFTVNATSTGERNGQYSTGGWPKTNYIILLVENLR